jgi:hypothetical protein
LIKVTVKGEVFSFDNEHYPLAEAMELESGLGMTFGEWQRALALGSARAAAGLTWLALKRDGRGVPLEDILSGKYALDVADIDAEPEGEPGDPTVSPADSAGGSGNGSAPSPSTTTTPLLTSAASPSPSSTA